MIVQSRIKRQGNNKVVIIWIPAHICIMGNERLDKIVKQALKKRDYRHRHQAFKIRRELFFLWKIIFKEWQKQWDQELKVRHLYS